MTESSPDAQQEVDSPDNARVGVESLIETGRERGRGCCSARRGNDRSPSASIVKGATQRLSAHPGAHAR